MKNPTKKTLKLLCAAIITMALFTACYRMPNDDEYCVIPTTNNPDVIGNSNSSNWMPGAGF